MRSRAAPQPQRDPQTAGAGVGQVSQRAERASGKPQRGAILTRFVWDARGLAIHHTKHDHFVVTARAASR